MSEKLVVANRMTESLAKLIFKVFLPCDQIVCMLGVCGDLLLGTQCVAVCVQLNYETEIFDNWLTPLVSGFDGPRSSSGSGARLPP